MQKGNAANGRKTTTLVTHLVLGNLINAGRLLDLVGGLGNELN